MGRRSIVILVASCLSSVVSAQTGQPIDAAVAFGAREAISHASLSPDGTKIAFLGPGPGQSVMLYSFDSTREAAPHVVLKSSGDPEVLAGCDWVANDRLACRTGGYQEYGGEIYGFTNVIAVNDDGSNLRMLSKK